MGSWGKGVFESDDAKDYAGDIVEDFSDALDSMADGISSSEGWSEHEDPMLVLASLTLTICDTAGVSPPQPSQIQKWRESYLKSFDSFGKRLWSSEADAAERRDVASGCFEKFLKFSEEWHSQ